MIQKDNTTKKYNILLWFAEALHELTLQLFNLINLISSNLQIKAYYLSSILTHLYFGALYYPSIIFNVPVTSSYSDLDGVPRIPRTSRGPTKCTCPSAAQIASHRPNRQWLSTLKRLNSTVVCGLTNDCRIKTFSYVLCLCVWNKIVRTVLRTF